MKIKPIADSDQARDGKVANGKDGAATAAKNKCDTYDEHQMTLAQLAERHAESAIEVAAPTKSRGLSADEAAKRLARDGPVSGIGPPFIVCECRIN